MPLPAIPFWIYAAVMAASEGANIAAQRKIDKERAKAMQEERLKRGALTRENEATADKSANLFENAREREDTRAAEMEKQLAASPTRITTSPTGETRLLDPTSPPSATSTVQSAKEGFAQTDQRLAERAKALAAANSFGSVMQDYGRGLRRNAQDIDMNSATMQQWANRVLPARLEYANQSGRQWSTTADILKLAATIMAPMALGGGAPAATQGLIADPSVTAAAGGAGGDALMAGSAGMSFDPYATMRAFRNARIFGPPL